MMNALLSRMNNKSWISRFAWPVLGATVGLVGVGCSKDAPPPRAQDAIIERTVPTPKPAPEVVAVTPNVSVSSELIAACKLRFNDPSSAPKFDFDESQVGVGDNDVLSQIATCVTAGPLAGRALDLVGRADPRGRVQYNLELGDRRATSVRAHLLGLGVNESNLAMSSRGKADATGTDEAGWQRDRRVDILLH